MNHGSLFSGIGGFDLAAQWMGWDNVFHVEWNPWCRKVLEHHFPNSESFTDVRQFDGSAWRGRVDIISGGFPCQPYSSAGKRLGKDDERHLWPEMLRIIREAAPAYVVRENVRGLLNWNGGVVFEEVCTDLEAMGYEVWTGILPAAGVGAPHRRDRIWWVATNSNNYRTVRGSETDESQGGAKRIQERDAVQRPDESGGLRVAANAQCDGLEHGTQRGGTRKSQGATRQRVAGHATSEGWAGFPTQPPVCGGDDGLPRELDGITFSKWRNESIKAYGNAIVPQVAYQIFQAIQNANEQH
jgi:DNA (cytosine-5)-methyltransferase 1